MIHGKAALTHSHQAVNSRLGNIPGRVSRLEDRLIWGIDHARYIDRNELSDNISITKGGDVVYTF